MRLDQVERSGRLDWAMGRLCPERQMRSRALLDADVQGAKRCGRNPRREEWSRRRRRFGFGSGERDTPGRRETTLGGRGRKEADLEIQRHRRMP